LRLFIWLSVRYLSQGVHLQTRSMKLIDILSLPLLIPHELSHYLVGRLLGVRMKLEFTQVRIYGYKRIPRWKMVVIVLAPTMLAVGLMIGFVAFFAFGEITWVRYRQALAGVTYAALLLTTCIGDWRSVWTDWRE
jgi:hypothetical protein